MQMKKHILVKTGYDYFKKNKGFVHFVKNEQDNIFLNDLKNNSHAFVLSCLMDRQYSSDKAWMIAIRLKEILGDFSMEVLSSISLEQYKNLFITNKLHRFNETMAEVFYEGVQLIHSKYNDKAFKIWENSPSSATVVLRFLEFPGCGIKIATMATNILARQFKIKFSDYNSIDVSPDTHVKRVMYRLGLVSKDADANEIIYKAREMNPEFPGIIDSPLWDIGRNVCKASSCDCDNCVLQDECNYAR